MELFTLENLLIVATVICALMGISAWIVKIDTKDYSKTKATPQPMDSARSKAIDDELRRIREERQRQRAEED